ncbi:MAG: phosphatidylserine decarboxylase [Planctomycetota bacterium]|jgi:phosphatidylserine decarboxylase
MPAPVATADPHAPVTDLDEAPIATIQPGGGFCFNWERRWGRMRRALLRRLRPGYVRRLEALRQGECAGCTHDVIDPRDLKLVRNVCGYRFRPEDDRFAWRGRLGLARAGLAELLLSTAACLAVAAPAAAAARWWHWGWWLVPVAVLVLWAQMVWFFRDPSRTPPADPDALLSPADGRITQLHAIDAPDFPGGRAFRISIYLSPWDVHLNRQPRDARVTAVRYFPGAFMTARREECVVRNEQLWVDLEEAGGRKLRLKQVSGSMARRIVCWLRVGETVRAGERWGIIKYGSRTDVLIPAHDARTVMVRIGDRVCAGTTVLLRFAEAPA